MDRDDLFSSWGKWIKKYSRLGLEARQENGDLYDICLEYEFNGFGHERRLNCARRRKLHIDELS